MNGSIPVVGGQLPKTWPVRMSGPASRASAPARRYGGSAHSFGFAIYSAAKDRYEDSALLTGFTSGSPQDALDTACRVRLTGLDR